MSKPRLTTVGDLRKAVEGLPDDKEVNLWVEKMVNETDHLVPRTPDARIISLNVMPMCLHVGIELKLRPAFEDDDDE